MLVVFPPNTRISVCMHLFKSISTVQQVVKTNAELRFVLCGLKTANCRLSCGSC